MTLCICNLYLACPINLCSQKEVRVNFGAQMAMTHDVPLNSYLLVKPNSSALTQVSGRPLRGALHVPTAKIVVLGSSFPTSWPSPNHRSSAKVFWKPPKLPILRVPREPWEQYRGKETPPPQFCATSSHLSPKNRSVYIQNLFKSPKKSFYLIHRILPHLPVSFLSLPLQLEGAKFNPRG